MTDKEKYTQNLMDAVGGIDDKYVYEAQNYTPKKRMPGYVAAIIAAAASMVLIIGAAVVSETDFKRAAVKAPDER